MAKRRNPQDATLRNVRAQKKQIDRLKRKIAVLEFGQRFLSKRLDAFERDGK